MNLTDFLSEAHILIRVPETSSKQAFLAHLAQEAVSRGLLPAEHQEDILNSLLDREAIGSSGIGEGVAVPHCQSEWVRGPVLVVATAPGGVPFDAVDNEPVRIAALLVYPEREQRTYIQALAMVARILRDRSRREALIQSNDAAEFYRLIAKEEEEGIERLPPPGRGYILALVLHQEDHYNAGLEAFAELGILDASVIDSVMVTKKLQDYLPLYAGLMGGRKKEKRSSMIVGVTRDPQAGKKLMTLLRKAGCDLLQPEAGVIVVVPAGDVLGGVLEGTNEAQESGA